MNIKDTTTKEELTFLLLKIQLLLKRYEVLRNILIECGEFDKSISESSNNELRTLEDIYTAYREAVNGNENSIGIGMCAYFVNRRPEIDKLFDMIRPIDINKLSDTVKLMNFFYDIVTDHTIASCFADSYNSYMDNQFTKSYTIDEIKNVSKIIEESRSNLAKYIICEISGTPTAISLRDDVIYSGWQIHIPKNYQWLYDMRSDDGHLNKRFYIGSSSHNIEYVLNELITSESRSNDILKLNDGRNGDENASN